MPSLATMLDVMLGAMRSAPALWLAAGIAATVAVRVAERWMPAAYRIPVRAAVHVLVPYAGLITGGLSPRLLGLSYVDWPAGLGFGTGFVFGALLLALGVRAFVELAAPRIPPPSEPIRDAQPRPNVMPNSMPWEKIGRMIVTSGAEEFHRTFVRGSIWEALLIAGVATDLARYWGTWLAAGILVLEAAMRRRNFAQWLILLTILLATSTLYFYTRNFWLCWTLHAALLAALAPLADRGQARLLAPKG